MRSIEDLGWGFHRRLNLMIIYVEFHTYMIHCFNLLENLRTYAILNLEGLCNAHGIGLSGLAAGGVEYVWENASLWKTINLINRFKLGSKNNP